MRRLDFPAFGGPATTTRTPSFSGSTRGRSSHAANSSPSSRDRRPQRRIDRLILLVIIDRPLGLRRQAEQPLLPCRDLLAQPAFGERQRGLALRFGLGLDQVGEALGFGQVDPAILERPAGEFARLGRPQPVDRGQRGEQRIHHRPPAMALKFHHILAGRAGRDVEPQDQRLVEQLADCGMRATRAPLPCAARASDPAIRSPAACARGPLTRITEIAAGGRPLDRAKIVSPRTLR